MVQKLLTALKRLPHLSEVKKHPGIHSVAFNFKSLAPDESTVRFHAATQKFRIGGSSSEEIIDIYPSRQLRSLWIMSLHKENGQFTSASIGSQASTLSDRQRKKILQFVKALRSPPN